MPSTFKNYQQLGLHRLPSSKANDYKILVYSMVNDDTYPTYTFSDETIMHMWEYACKNTPVFSDVLSSITAPDQIRRMLTSDGVKLLQGKGPYDTSMTLGGFHIQNQDFCSVNLERVSLSGAHFTNVLFDPWRQLLDKDLTNTTFNDCIPYWLNDPIEMNKKLNPDYIKEIKTQQEKYRKLFQAAAHYDQKTIKTLLSPEDMDITNKDGDTLLNVAVRTSDSSIPKLLLGYGVNPNIQKSKGNTPPSYGTKMRQWKHRQNPDKKWSQS